MTTELEDRRLIAVIDLLRRVGAESFEIRYSEPENAGSPVVWIAIITLHTNHPAGPGVPPQVAAGLDPVHAAERLAEQLIDGGKCTHCQLPTVFQTDPTAGPLPFLKTCAYQYDPELNTYRRSCEDPDKRGAR